MVQYVIKCVNYLTALPLSTLKYKKASEILGGGLTYFDI